MPERRYDSPYDALLTREPAIPAALAERYGETAVFSPTALEMYAACPFRFYLGRVLGLEPLPGVDLDLTALERGSLLHKIAFRFYAGWRGDGKGAVTETSYPAALQRSSRRPDGRHFPSTARWLVEKNTSSVRNVSQDCLARLTDRPRRPSSPCPWLSFGLR